MAQSKMLNTHDTSQKCLYYYVRGPDKSKNCSQSTIPGTNHCERCLRKPGKFLLLLCQESAFQTQGLLHMSNPYQLITIEYASKYKYLNLLLPNDQNISSFIPLQIEGIGNGRCVEVHHKLVIVECKPNKYRLIGVALGFGLDAEVRPATDREKKIARALHLVVD